MNSKTTAHSHIEMSAKEDDIEHNEENQNLCFDIFDAKHNE